MHSESLRGARLHSTDSYWAKETESPELSAPGCGIPQDEDEKEEENEAEEEPSAPGEMQAPAHRTTQWPSRPPIARRFCATIPACN
jgi:hypothetical protein